MMRWLLILFATVAAAPMPRAESPWVAPVAPGVAFDQPLGASLPLDPVFRDEEGRVAPVGKLFGRRPVVLLFGYSRCPQLCPVVVNGTVEALRGVTAPVGREFDVIYLSIDPTDTPRDLAAMKRRDVGRYGRTGSERGWHYLAGDEGAIRRVAAAAGFRYTFDPRTKLYAHPSGFVVTTPDGRISRTFLGVDFAPRDVAAALEQAAAGRIGPPQFNLLLACARGLGIGGRYGALIWSGLVIAVIVTVLVLLGGIGSMLRTEWQRNRRAADAAPGSALAPSTRQPDAS